MDITKHRTIRSYVKRQGRMTKAQKRAIDVLWKTYGVEIEGKKIDLDTLFKRNAPKILEIGFGMGENLLEMARLHPEQDFIGIDIHKPGIGAVLMGIKKDNLSNIRLFCADAVEVLTSCIYDENLDAVYLLFPDPWPKKRHHKRRIVQPSFANLIYSKLKSTGHFHIATDWENYAEHILEVMNSFDGFANGSSHECLVNRAPTRFEQRGKKLGHNIWDFIFVKCKKQ